MYESELGARKQLTDRADETDGGGSESAMILDSSGKQSRSDAGAMTVGCGAKNLRSGNYDAYVLASLAAKVRRATTPKKV